MAERKDLVIGTDRKIAVYAIKKSNGAAINLSLFDGYGIYLYYDIDKTTIAKYSSNVVGGWNSDDLDTTDEVDGKIVINFQRELSILGRSEKQVYGQIVAQYTDPDFSGTQFRDIVEPFYMFHFIRGGITDTVDMG